MIASGRTEGGGRGGSILTAGEDGILDCREAEVCVESQWGLSWTESTYLDVVGAIHRDGGSAVGQGTPEIRASLVESERTPAFWSTRP